MKDIRNKKAILYCDKRSINNATSHYLSIIKNAIEKLGYIYEINGDLRSADVIITITAKYFFKSYLMHPWKKHVFWSQGVAAEEARMNVKGLNSWLHFICRRVMEPIAVLRADFLLCVSHAMVDYYKSEFGLKNEAKCYVMPCFNQSLSEKFDLSQYESPTFVYAGNASTWQSVDLMLDVYALVEKALPQASITILSKQREIFEQKIKTRGIKNYSINYVSLQEIDDVLRKHKYGFILREKHVVNWVATPTKMNSYLANYLIPVFSDAVADFNENVQLGKYSLKMRCPLQASEIASKIILFEENNTDYSDYHRIVKDLFEDHYNTTKYINRISNLLAQIL